MCDMNFSWMNFDGLPGHSGWMVVMSKPRIADELSSNAITLFLRRSGVSVSFTMRNRLRDFFSPSMIMFPPKNQCRECSLFDCAMSNSSTSVGSRFITSQNRCV